ncbi:unnamed protein product [Phytomonas sp. Hart1]|nr:unnamed protein product [Phytomonas sp. Hart1]|eukprot:CCW68859.1 unnamed protein product [Phytomonas sp. isolate Hart1]
MHVLNNGTPLTNGEVYALLRRRRDERSAEVHPPFGLQHVQADSQNRASSHYGPAGRLLPAHTHGSVGSSASSAEASRILLSSPSSAHLRVLLTEVRLLNYLGNYAHLTNSKDGALRNIYGPSTVYAQQQQPESTLTRVGMGNKNDNLEVRSGEGCFQKDSHVPVSSKYNTNDDKSAGLDTCKPRCETKQSDLINAKQWQEVIIQSRAGSREHVHAVQQILTYYEEQGYQREKNWGHKIRSYVEALHFNTPHKTVKCEPSDSDEGTYDASGEFLLSPAIFSTTGVRPANAINVRALLSTPQNLHVNTRVIDFTSYSGHAHPSLNSMYHEGIVAESLFLTEQELMQLVVGRPRSSLDVYRLLDNLTERFGSDEEAAARFVNFITHIFGTSIDEDKALNKSMKESDDTLIELKRISINN